MSGNIRSRNSPRLTQLEDRRAPAIATWDGGGADNHWSTAANWVGDVAPNPGDDLVFPADAAQLTNVNDLPAGTAFNSISLSSDTVPKYNLSGNAIVLAAGLRSSGSFFGRILIGLPIKLSADQTFSFATFTLSGSLDLNGHALTVSSGGGSTISGAITGAGSMTIAGGDLELLGINTYIGPTLVTNGGSLGVNGSIPGSVTVSSNIGRSTLYGTGTVGDVTIDDHNLIGVGPQIPPSPHAASTLSTGNLTVTGDDCRTVFSTDQTASDRIDVHGSVHLAGLLFLLPTAYTPVPTGTQFTLISNDGTDPIDGTFTDFPEGSIYKREHDAVRISYHGGDGNDVVATVVNYPSYAVGAGAGGLPLVNVYDGFGVLLRSFRAYDASFHGGVRVVTVEMNQDGVPDIITAPGPGGGPDIRVWDGATGAMIREFNAYDPAFRGGVFLAIADENSDSHPDIITGAGAGGGPHVKVFDGNTGAVIQSFMAYDIRFRGGISVAGIDGTFIMHQGLFDGLVITGAGPGGGPHVKVFDGVTGALASEFLAYDSSFRGGVNVAAHADRYLTPAIQALTMVAAPASAGGPDVRIYNLAGQRLGGFLAYDPSFFGGVTLAQHPLFSQNPDVIITGAGPGGGPHVKIWALSNNAVTLQSNFFAFDPAFIGGVFVG